MYYLQYGPTKSRRFPTVLGAKRHQWEFANRVRPTNGIIRLKNEDGELISTFYYKNNIGWVDVIDSSDIISDAELGRLMR